MKSHKTPQLIPIQPMKNDILDKLKEYQKAITERLDNGEFVLYITALEKKDWTDSLKTLENLKSTSNTNNAITINYLNDIAQKSYDTIAQRGIQVAKAVIKLRATLEQINAALAVLEVNTYVHSINSEMISATIGNSDFNIIEEERGIKLMLHATDALLEITQ